ncbi:MAG: amidophosphoribosyltransferase [bacterium]|nr:amidophosphoribosyltransferase [bacterium]
MCGILGAYNVGGLKDLIEVGLNPLQHRGVEGAGFFASSLDGHTIFHLRKYPLAEDLYTSREFIEWHDGDARLAAAHVRYGTCGSLAHEQNIQPIMHMTRWGRIAVAHNGDTPNAQRARVDMLNQGKVFESDSDSEMFLHDIADTEAETVFDAIATVLARKRATFSLLLAGEGWLVAARDPWGNRPLSIAKLDNGWIVASETVVHDVLRAEYLRDVDPGEMLIFTNGSMTSRRFKEPCQLHQCVFERTYMSRPDSVVFGGTVADFRRAIGQYMGRRVPRRYANEVVVPVPDSGIQYASGFVLEHGGPMEIALVRSHYSGRNYIQPGQNRREKSIRKKLNPIRSLIAKKTVILIDDSIVRGTTSRKVNRMLRGAGAERIIFVSCYPPVTGQCHYGVLMEDSLVAKDRTIEEIRSFIEADELYYPDPDDYKKLTGDPKRHCFACFDGIYPALLHKIQKEP